MNFLYLRRTTGIFLLGLMFALPAQTFAENGYFRNMGRDLWRGVRNVIGAPLEIPLTMKDHYDQHDQAAAIDMASGFTDGFFRMVERWGSAVVDVAVSVIPGQQEGIPMEPQTLF